LSAADILDEFHAPAPTSASKSVAAPAASTSSSAINLTTLPPLSDGDAFNADFAEEFARQMEATLRELGGDDVATSSTASAGSSADVAKEQEEVFKKAWEKLLVDGLDGTGMDEKHDTASVAGGMAGKEDPFQKNIREAMERLKESDANIQVRVTITSLAVAANTPRW
jgi:peroxin-19